MTSCHYAMTKWRHVIMATFCHVGKASTSSWRHVVDDITWCMSSWRHIVKLWRHNVMIYMLSWRHVVMTTYISCHHVIMAWRHIVMTFSMLWRHDDMLSCVPTTQLLWHPWAIIIVDVMSRCYQVGMALTPSWSHVVYDITWWNVVMTACPNVIMTCCHDIYVVMTTCHHDNIYIMSSCK